MLDTSKLVCFGGSHMGVTTYMKSMINIGFDDYLCNIILLEIY